MYSQISLFAFGHVAVTFKCVMIVFASASASASQPDVSVDASFDVQLLQTTISVDEEASQVWTEYSSGACRDSNNKEYDSYNKSGYTGDWSDVEECKEACLLFPQTVCRGINFVGGNCKLRVDEDATGDDIALLEAEGWTCNWDAGSGRGVPTGASGGNTAFTCYAREETTTTTTTTTTLPFVQGSVTIQQPAEEKGSYTDRSYTQTACELIQGQNGCWDLDDFICEAGGRCLKWGGYCYAGRISLPEGVDVQTFGGFSGCDGTAKYSFQGAVSEESFWNYHSRSCSFKFTLQSGYQCA